MTPSFVDTKDIEQGTARGAWGTVCKGLEMSEDRIRQYATEQLWKNNAPPEKLTCICEHLPKEGGGFDPAIAAGLEGMKSDAIASCFAELVKNPNLNKREEAIIAFSKMTAPSVRSVLAEVAAAEGDMPSRIRATEKIEGDPEHKATLMKLLDHEDNGLRAAAAKSLGGHKDKATVDALINVASTDPEGTVRAAALVAVKTSGVSKASDMVCKAMMDDASPAVREAAIRTLRGTRRDSAVKCLREKAFKEETDASVRDALLAVLKSSPNDNAALVLCDAIPFWMRTYVKDDIPDKIPGTMIVKTQNDRDWERSYECFKKAYQRSSGYSCFAKMHVGLWFREVGGKNYVPSCPGYENTDKE